MFIPTTDNRGYLLRRLTLECSHRATCQIPANSCRDHPSHYLDKQASDSHT